MTNKALTTIYVKQNTLNKYQQAQIKGLGLCTKLSLLWAISLNMCTW